MRKKQKVLPIKAKNITFVALHANGLLKEIQSNLLKIKMVKVQILTTPLCTTCSQVEKMLDKLKVKYDIIDFTKKPEFLKKYPILVAPGIVINGKLEFTGVPKLEDLKRKLK